MEENAQLEDLAILFVGLAKGADGQFHYRELEMVTDLLRKKMGGDKDGAIPALVDRVLQKFEHSTLSWEGVVGDAVIRLDDLLSESEKRGVLTDLSKIGLADRKFLHAEAAYIQEVKESWGISLLEGQPSDWSILGEGGIQGEVLQALGVLYLSIAYLPDEEISLSEREKMIAKLGQWVPDAREEEVDLALQDAMALFITRSADENVKAATDTVRRLVPRHQVPIIYQDLQSISESDNVLAVEERTWLEKIAGAFGISQD